MCPLHKEIAILLRKHGSDVVAHHSLAIHFHNGIAFSCAFDKFEDQMKTFLNPPSGSFSTIGNEMTNILDKLNLN